MKSLFQILLMIFLSASTASSQKKDDAPSAELSQILEYQNRIDSLSMIIFARSLDTAVSVSDRYQAVADIKQIHLDKSIGFLIENQHIVLPMRPEYGYSGGAEEIAECHAFFYGNMYENRWRVLAVVLEILHQKAFEKEQLQKYYVIVNGSFSTYIHWTPILKPIFEAELNMMRPGTSRNINKNYYENLVKMIELCK